MMCKATPELAQEALPMVALTTYGDLLSGNRENKRRQGSK